LVLLEKIKYSRKKAAVNEENFKKTSKAEKKKTALVLVVHGPTCKPVN
jgi:hypothetical protein